MKIVAITPHPDDLEIACAGTLKKFQDQGAEIISIVTVKPSAEVNSERNEDIVLEELKKDKQCFGTLKQRSKCINLKIARCGNYGKKTI
jgi:hypothetical protein